MLALARAKWGEVLVLGWKLASLDRQNLIDRAAKRKAR